MSFEHRTNSGPELRRNLSKQTIPENFAMQDEDQKRKFDYIAALREDPVNNLAANTRPLYNLTASDDSIIIKVGGLAKFFLENAEKVGVPITDGDRTFCEGVQDRLRWATERFHIYEHALLGLNVGRTTNVELAELLGRRSEVLYRLFGIGRGELSNEQIIETIKQSSDPRVTDGLYFSMNHHREVIHYPSLLKEFLDKVDKWQDDREAIAKARPTEEPEMFEIHSYDVVGDERADPDRRTHRFIRQEWIEWHQYQHGSVGRGVSYDDTIQTAVATLVKQLFPEGKPVDVEVKVDTHRHQRPGYEVIVRRVVTNAEYF